MCFFLLRWKQEKVENGEMDISDNNNTNEKNKNGCVSPDLDQHTLYSQGEFYFLFLSHIAHTTIGQTRECANGPGVMPGVKTWQSSASTSQVSILRNCSGFELSHCLSGAHIGRQEHGAGSSPDANRLPARAAAAEGEGEAAGDDEPPAPEQEAGGGEGEDEVRAGRRTREWVSKDSGA